MTNDAEGVTKDAEGGTNGAEGVTKRLHGYERLHGYGRIPAVSVQSFVDLHRTLSEQP